MFLVSMWVQQHRPCRVCEVYAYELRPIQAKVK